MKTQILKSEAVGKTPSLSTGKSSDKARKQALGKRIFLLYRIFAYNEIKPSSGERITEEEKNEYK